MPDRYVVKRIGAAGDLWDALSTGFASPHFSVEDEFHLVV